MSKSLLRTNREITEIYERNYKMIYRICFAYLKNPVDTEDVVQNTFIKLIKLQPYFENPEHEKAWLIRISTNICKNFLRSGCQRCESIDDHLEAESYNNLAKETENNYILKVVMDLPDRYKTSVYLYYYEGYSSVEIADILNKPRSTIRNYLHEARKILKERLGDDFK